MRAAAAAEGERVEREVARLTAREAVLAAELTAVQAARTELEDQRHILIRFAHGDERPRTPGTAGRRQGTVSSADTPFANGLTPLRGARIRETAVLVLAPKVQQGAPVHYRDWFALLTSAGFMPTGKDPLATFLTQIGRSPVVQRTTTSGMYVLDLEFPRRGRERLAQLTLELAELHELRPGAGVEEIAAARERRRQLTAEMQDTERRLEEALRSLGEVPVDG